MTKLKDVSFTAYGGEILGIAGISGCGQKELLEAIAGLQPVDPAAAFSTMKRTAPAEELIGKSPMKIQEMGVHLSFVPEDRLGMGLVGNMGMTGNMMLRSYQQGQVRLLPTGRLRRSWRSASWKSWKSSPRTL